MAATIEHIVPALSIAFAAGSALGFITQQLRLSPILGYLIAGFLVGPYSPGIIIDVQLSEQLAEIGVVLMMFGVGIHFNWQDLSSVKYVATFGAIGQTFFTALITTLLVYLCGFPISVGTILGFSICVASTVVLVRMLGDHHLLETPQGLLAVGWTVVEDIFTVTMLILLPPFAQAISGLDYSIKGILLILAGVFTKFFLLGVIMFTAGKWLVSKILLHAARVQSHELFTLAVLALTFLIAAISSVVFGASIALGAFIAGMIIGQSAMKHQASANALPIRDAFVGLFFLSVGMLFNPMAIVSDFPLFIAVLIAVMIVKPVAAYFIAIFFKQPPVVALTLAIALAQIGEFSFILTEEALRLKILPDEGYDIVVAVALVSIALNPILFKLCADHLHTNIKDDHNVADEYLLTDHPYSSQHKAVIVGLGSAGRGALRALEELNFDCLVVDRNVDAVESLHRQGKQAIFGDFTQAAIAEAARIQLADMLVITLPSVEASLQIIDLAKEYNHNITIVARSELHRDIFKLREEGAHVICWDDELRDAFHNKVGEIARQQFS